VQVISSVFNYSLDPSQKEHKQLLDKWAKIADKLGRLNSKRNEIAHGLSFVQREPGKPDVRGWTPYLNFSTFQLSIQPKEAKAKRTRKITPLSAATIMARERAFLKMYKHLGDFAHSDVLPVMRQLERLELPRAK
jgi:hypothetical protein